jgi:hypothetical protein
VEVLVADPSFKGTYAGGILKQICLKYSIELYWHRGFTLMVHDVPSDFRGPSMPSLEKNSSAVMDLYSNPKNWAERGTCKEVLQELKLLWHFLVRYGKQ